MLKIRINPYVMQLFALVLFMSIPFVHINHTIIYICMEAICLYGILNFNRTIFNDVFFKYYLWFIGWCIIVTILSVKPMWSFKALTTIMVPPLILLGLYDGCFIKYVNRFLIVCSIIVFLISLSFCLTFYFNINFMPFKLLDAYGGGRITSSTLSLCIICYTMFFNKSYRSKIFIISINVLSGLILKEGAFIFTLFISGFLYWAIVVKNIAVYKIIISILVIIGAIQFLLLNVLHFNLHIYERLHIYSYWLDKIFYSPVRGIGLGLKLESSFYTTRFPIPPEIFSLDPNIELHAHNYFLDLMLQTGVVGLSMMVFFFYKICRESYLQDNKAGWAVFFIIFVIMMKNMVDDEIDGSRGLIYWFFIVAAYVSIQIATKHVQDKRSN